MLKSKIDKKSLDELYALSCVENYILSYLRNKGINVSLLYYSSYIPFERIFKDFHNENMKYAYYGNLKRLQKVAEEKNLIEIIGCNNQSVNQLLKIDSYSLVGIKLDFFMEKYRKALWRPDHYIYIEKIDESSYYFLNDNPRDEGIIKRSELELLFNGEIIYFKKIGNIVSDDVMEFINEFHEEILKERDLNIEYALITEENLIKTRDFLGVLRISRKRIERFLNNFMNTDFMQDYLMMISKLYASIEYQRFRKKYEVQKIINSIREIQNNDSLVINQIIEKVGGVINE
jgi:hypothetical protein